MFKNGLLISTALRTVASLLFAVQPAASAQKRMQDIVAGRDANAEFLCTYGQFLVSAYSDNLNGYSAWSSTWNHVAVPVREHGQTVSRIKVIEAQASNTSNSAFSAGVYSNTPSGFPGKLIAGGTGKAGPTCGPVTIKIAPTKLKRHTTYWIEETTSTPGCPSSMRAGSVAKPRGFRPPECSSYVGLYWEANPRTKRKAYVQHHYEQGDSGTVSSSYTTPWKQQSTGPYFRLK
jgi:hypothetical protein